MEHVQHTRNPTAHNYSSQTVYSSGLQSVDEELAPFQGLHEVTPIFIITPRWYVPFYSHYSTSLQMSSPEAIRAVILKQYERRIQPTSIDI